MKKLIILLLFLISVSVAQVGTIASMEWAADSLTVATEVDTISAPTGSLWWSIEITSGADTLEFSLKGDFSTVRGLIPAQTKKIKRISSTVYPELYVRRKGAYGTGVYSIDIIAF